MNKKTEKKIKLLEKGNSKVLITNSSEANILYELAINTDKIFTRLNKIGGVKIDLNEYLQTKKDFLRICSSIDKYLQNIAHKADMKDINTPLMLNEANKINQTKG